MNTKPARRNIETLLERVDGSRGQLEAYLPEGVNVDRFMALARRTIAEQPELADCSATSVLRALSRCAESGLPLDGQFSSLIIYKSKKGGRPTARWDPSYRGMISLAMSSGFVTEVQSFAVTEHDEFSVELGSEPKIKHVPALLTGGRIVAAYAWARLRSGRLVIEILGRADLDKIKEASPAGERGPWGSWESQMARKSAVRRLLKKLPASPFRAVLEASAEPYAMSATVVGPSATHAAIAPPAKQATLPEDDNALECKALERLRDANGEAELAGAWAQSQVEHSQAGLEISAAVSNAYQELTEALGGDIEDPERDEWLKQYDNAPG